MLDKYDHAITKIMARIHLMREETGRVMNDEWSCHPYEDFPKSPLFQYMTDDGGAGNRCGCLTQIRSSHEFSCNEYKAQWPELTAKIAEDERIPYYTSKIDGAEDLFVFAEYQRLADKNYRKKEAVQCSFKDAKIYDTGDSFAESGISN